MWALKFHLVSRHGLILRYFKIFASCDDSVVLSIPIFSLVNLMVCGSIMSKLINFLFFNYSEHRAAVLCLAWENEMLISGSYDKTVVLHDLRG